MKKFLILSLILGVLVFASPVWAKEGKSSFWAATSKLVQEIFQPEEIPVFEEGHEEELAEEDFVDPKEVQQVLREMKDQRRELSRLSKQVRRLAGAESILGEINTLLEQVAGFEGRISEGTDLRDTIQEFRDAQIWEELNKIRAKIEIPRELAQWNKEIKRLEKMLKQKKFQNTGIDLIIVRSKIEEIKATLVRVQEFYNSGDFESAMEEFNELREGFHPGEIMSVVQRMGDIMNRLRSVKNAEIKNQVMESLGEVVSNFNEGEFRTARELLDESFGEIMKLINQALSVGKRRGASREGFNKMADKLQDQMRGKSEMKRGQFQPQPIQPTESAPRPIESFPTPAPIPIPAPAETIRPVEPSTAPATEARPTIEPTR